MVRIQIFEVNMLFGKQVHYSNSEICIYTCKVLETYHIHTCMFVPRVKSLAATPLRIVCSGRAGTLNNALKIMHTLNEVNTKCTYTLGTFIAVWGSFTWATGA